MKEQQENKPLAAKINDSSESKTTTAMKVVGFWGQCLDGLFATPKHIIYMQNNDIPILRMGN